jgi:hypothetical protein
VADLARLFDFTANDVIRSSEVDAELNQLVDRIGNLQKDDLLDKIISERKLFPQNGLVRASGGTGINFGAPGGGWTDTPGATVTFTPEVASFVIVHAFFDLEVKSNAGATNGVLEGRLAVDATGEAAVARLEVDRNDNAIRATVGQVYRVALTAAAHTVRLQHNYSSGASSGSALKFANTGFSWWLLSQ